MGNGVSVGSNDILTLVSLENTFAEFDADNNGYLENDELTKVVQLFMGHFGDRLGDDPKTSKEIVMAHIDLNQDGKLDFNEFKQLLDLLEQRSLLIERAIVKFKEFDTNKSNYLEAKEIDQVILWTLQATQLEESTNEYKTKLLRMVDKNQDCKLDLNEFIGLFEDMLIRGDMMRLAKSKFESMDIQNSGSLDVQSIRAVLKTAMTAYIMKDQAVKNRFVRTAMMCVRENGYLSMTLPLVAEIIHETLLRMDLYQKAEAMFKTLDTDGSGFLERSELEVATGKWFSMTSKELNYVTFTDVDTLLAQVDNNGDGKVSLSEFIPLFENTISNLGIWLKA